MAIQEFKTIYFPRDKVRRLQSARVSISFQPDSESEDFVSFLRKLTSRDVRLALGDAFLEDLELLAHAENRSFSNLCVSILRERFDAVSSASSPQMSFGFGNGTSEPLADLGITFQENRHRPVHHWYPYVEGFSATYARDALLRTGRVPRSIYDPFGGAGTTMLSASVLGIPSFYSEINPVMRFVAETKVSSGSWARRNVKKFTRLAESYLKIIANDLLVMAKAVDLKGYHDAFPDRDFFVEKDIRELIAARDLAHAVCDGERHALNLILLACTANVVHASNMTRRSDLRRRRPDEYKNRVVDVRKSIEASLRRMINEIPGLPATMKPTKLVSVDCRSPIPSEYRNAVELILTSPPYLNGTNYFRNTKLELWFLGYLTQEDELSDFRQVTVAAGINDVSNERPQPKRFDCVESVAEVLDEESKDKRIPKLVRLYFSDMYDVFVNARNMLTPQGRFILDIGDSKFYGVHVPTHKLMAEVAEEAGLSIDAENVLARRHSRDKTPLVQVELIMSKPKKQFVSTPAKSTSSLQEAISNFERFLPYKEQPYQSRAWGHKLHQLCSYQGKLKPSIAHWLVSTFTNPGDRILDPLGGVGTIALEAALQGRPSLSNDKSPFAAIVAASKIDPPTYDDAMEALDSISHRISRARVRKQDLEEAKFGLNGSVVDFYHPNTLNQVLRARRVFLECGDWSPAEKFVWASLLHILHGNRPYALSRKSHPVTPFHPSGTAVDKDLVQHTRDRMLRVLSVGLPDEFISGVGVHRDFRELDARKVGTFDCVITSPPFFGMRFDRPNWLRLWFCGWSEQSFLKDSLGFIERQQMKSLSCYDDLASVCSKLLRKHGLMIIHVGSGAKKNLSELIQPKFAGDFTILAEVSESVEHVERHGLNDKGLTTAHHFLFLRKKR